MIVFLYYMYYLFYLKKLKDTEPHVRTIWGISFLFFCVAIGGLNLIWVVLFSKMVNFWIMMASFPLIILIVYIIYYRSGKGKYIVEHKKPLFRNSLFLSICFAIVFTFLCVSLLVIVPVLIRPILQLY